MRGPARQKEGARGSDDGGICSALFLVGFYFDLFFLTIYNTHLPNQQNNTRPNQNQKAN